MMVLSIGDCATKWEELRRTRGVPAPAWPPASGSAVPCAATGYLPGGRTGHHATPAWRTRARNAGICHSLQNPVTYPLVALGEMRGASSPEFG